MDTLMTMTTTMTTIRTTRTRTSLLEERSLGLLCRTPTRRTLAITSTTSSRGRDSKETMAILDGPEANMAQKCSSTWRRRRATHLTLHRQRYDARRRRCSLTTDSRPQRHPIYTPATCSPRAPPLARRLLG